jgi:hypothetical protein
MIEALDNAGDNIRELERELDEGMAENRGLRIELTEALLRAAAAEHRLHLAAAERAELGATA